MGTELVVLGMLGVAFASAALAISVIETTP